jgi:hypothetical protein
MVSAIVRVGPPRNYLPDVRSESTKYEAVETSPLRSKCQPMTVMDLPLFPLVRAQSSAQFQNSNSTATVQKAPANIRSLKVTLLSTMLVCSTTGLGEWGFPALIEAGGHRVSLDTGAHPDTVLQMHIT